MEEGLTKKAELLHGGMVRIPEGFDPPLRISHSVDGPGNAIGTAIFNFDHFRVKKQVSYTEGEFELQVSDRGWMSLHRDDKLFVDDVKIIPVLRHCHDQAIFNIDHDHIYNSYCTTPFMDAVDPKTMKIDDMLSIIKENNSELRIKSVTFVSEPSTDIDRTIDRIVEATTAVKEAFPRLTVGVEQCMMSSDHISQLRGAGVNEIKINIYCARRDIYERVFPEFDYDGVINTLREANTLYKKGKLATDIIYGLGETDQDIDILLERMCRMNVLPNLRMIRPQECTNSRLASAGIVPETPTILRSMFLGGLQKSAMKRHGLDPSRFHSMCFNCQCCDLIPFKDF